MKLNKTEGRKRNGNNTSFSLTSALAHMHKNS